MSILVIQVYSSSELNSACGVIMIIIHLHHSSYPPKLKPCVQ